MKLNQIFMRILKLVYLNFLWICGTLAGLIVFGIGPSTASIFSITREWFRGNDDIPIFATFIRNYKVYFKTSILLSLLYTVAGTILVIDYIYASSWEARVFYGIILFLYSISATYIFPVLVHYRLKSLMEYIKYSFLVGFSYLQYTLVLYLIVLTIYFLVAQFYPGLTTFFGVSFLIFMIMKIASAVFNRIEESEKALKSK